MALTSVGSGTQTAVIDTEHTLDTETDAGVYVLVIDTANLADGDVVMFKIKTKYASGGTSRLAFSVRYANSQPEPIKYSPPVPVDTEIICTLEQTDGGSGIAITAFADAGGSTTTVTSEGHGLSNGDKVLIAGTTNYNGTHSVSGVDGNNYVIDTAYVADDATGTGTRAVFFPWNLLKV